MRSIVRALRGALAVVVSVVATVTLAAQSSRDDWKQGPPFTTLQEAIKFSLADAPLSARERMQIYRAIDDKTIHDSFTDQERDKERETVLSARVGFIALAADGNRQILVQGPSLFCGATGNCSLWIFVRDRGSLRLVLDAGGGILILRPTSSHGFRDLATGWHMSGFEENFKVYRWDGASYRQADCYIASWDRTSNSTNNAPTISDCPKASR